MQQQPTLLTHGPNRDGVVDEKCKKMTFRRLLSAISFVETEHGRLRRRQRGIDRKNSNWQKNIVNEANSEEVTSYAIPLTLDYVLISDIATIS
jgi:hypothetical protein